MRRFFVGLDLGQVNDYSTIAVLERAEVKGEWDPAMFAHKQSALLNVRHLDRIELGTPYPEVVKRVGQVTRSGDLAQACELIVDATGVGRPVVDLLRAEHLGCGMKAAMITGGMAETYTNGFHHVPKTNLITGLQVALQRGDLRIAGGMRFGETLTREMTEMRVKITAHANEQFGAWREGTHDDLVFAAALACWGARKAYPFDVSGAQRYWATGPRG